MEQALAALHRLKWIYGLIGVLCWLLILPVKLGRYFDTPASRPILAIIPSVLGPAGLLFVLLSSEGRMGRLSLIRVTGLAAAVAATLEFSQLLPGVRRIYTFDWCDVATTLVSIGAATLVAAGLRRRLRMASGAA